MSDADLKLMHRIDKLCAAFPFAGSRVLQGLLVRERFKVVPSGYLFVRDCRCLLTRKPLRIHFRLIQIFKQYSNY